MHKAFAWKVRTLNASYMLSERNVILPCPGMPKPLVLLQSPIPFLDPLVKAPLVLSNPH